MIQFPLGKQHHIAVIDNCLTAEFCDELVEFCEQHFDTLFERGVMLERFDPDYKNSLDWGIKSTATERLPQDLQDKAEQFDQVVFENLNKAINLYKNEYWGLDGWMTINDTGYRIQKYLKGEGFYKAHVDGSPWAQNAIQRVLGVVLYLNTVEEGGQTGFPDHDYKVKAVKGRISIFPAYWTHPHTAEIPLSNDKWIISSFITI